MESKPWWFRLLWKYVAVSGALYLMKVCCTKAITCWNEKLAQHGGGGGLTPSLLPACWNFRLLFISSTASITPIYPHLYSASLYCSLLTPCTVHHQSYLSPSVAPPALCIISLTFPLQYLLPLTFQQNCLCSLYSFNFSWPSNSRTEFECSWLPSI